VVEVAVIFQLYDILFFVLNEEEESDSDEPLLSGSGGVSKDCSETELVSWGEVLALWTTTRPKQLTALVEVMEPRGSSPGALFSGFFSFDFIFFAQG
jgi:hypothetical protein